MRLAIADDHGIFRSSLRRALEDIGAEVPVSVANGEDLLAELGRHQIDIAIVDVAMPPAYHEEGNSTREEGLTTAQAIGHQYPGIKVLLLSAETATPQAIALLRNFRSGIGYLRKDEISDAEELEKVLGLLVRGTGGRPVGRGATAEIARARVGPGRADASGERGSAAYGRGLLQLRDRRQAAPGSQDRRGPLQQDLHQTGHGSEVRQRHE